MAKATMYFPRDFKWGCATAAHQVEGGNDQNDWWAWEQGAGHIKGGQKSGRASDWWGDGFEKDMDFAAQLHNNAHRLSIEWSRIEPSEGRWEEAALDRYRTMLKSMRERGIEPMITLHHFTSPHWLAERGGWETPAAVPLFERFVTKAVESLKDLCDLWITINEPNVYAVGGWVNGLDQANAAVQQNAMPPGKNDLGLAFNVIDNLLLGHAAAYHAIHRLQDQARVGLAHHMRLFEPYRSNSVLDRWVAGNRDRVFNQTILDAMLRGRVRFVKRNRALRNTADFIGLNYYTREFTKFDGHSLPGMALGNGLIKPGIEMSDGHYGEIYAQGLFRFLKRLERTGKPIYITENGLPDADDDQRPRFLITHLRAIWQAINQNVPVMGYYHWSLVDNFEWAEGWNLRFGLVELNPQTQERKLRRSGELYGEVCQTGTLTQELVYKYTPELAPSLFPG